MPQLARAQARQPGAHGPHLHQDLLGAPGRTRLALAALVEALPAHAVEAAATLRTHGFFGPQAANGRQEDFFGNGMPWSSSTTCSIVRSNKFRSWAFFYSLVAKRFCSCNCVSSCLMRCSRGCSTARVVPGERGPQPEKPRTGIALAPGQERGPALDAVAPLGLFITQLVAADFAYHGQLKGQTVVTLTTPHARLRRVLHDIFRKSINT